MTVNFPSLTPSLFEQLASTELLDEAYAWLCHARKDAGHNHSIWDLRRRWTKIRTELQHRLLNQTFEFGSCKSVFIGGKCLSCWDAEDSIVQKALCLLLTPHLSSRINQRCVHLSGKGGCQGTVLEVKVQSRKYSYVLKSDVKSYYSTMDHSVVLSLMRKHLPDPAIVRLLESFLTHVTDWRGEVEINALGIAKGSPLSPLLGALYLTPLDEAIDRTVARCRGYYVRFMDDWVVLMKTRHQLRRVIRITQQVLSKLNVKIYPRKTFIGRITKGFDFLGLHFCSSTVPPLEEMGFSLPLALGTVKKHLSHRFRLYERGSRDNTRIGTLTQRWIGWVFSACGGPNEQSVAVGSLICIAKP